MAKSTFVVTNGATIRDIGVSVWRAMCKMWDESGERTGVKITVQTAVMRNLEQNALMWALLAEISDQIKWHGIPLEPKEWKELLTAGLHKTKVVPNIEGNGFVVIGSKTSDMSVKEMSELIELIYAFGAEHGVRFVDKRASNGRVINGTAKRLEDRPCAALSAQAR